MLQIDLKRKSLVQRRIYNRNTTIPARTYMFRRCCSNNSKLGRNAETSTRMPDPKKSQGHTAKPKASETPNFSSNLLWKYYVWVKNATDTGNLYQNQKMGRETMN